MKTVILTHADCDGMCAGAIAQAAFPDAEVFFTKPVSFIVDLKQTKASRIIVADIAMTKRNADEIVQMLNKRSKTIAK